MRRFLLLAPLLALLLVACSPAHLRPYAIVPAAETRPSAVGNRLVVQAADGNLFTINPDGSGRVNLTDDAGATRQYRQPTWSPDATFLAAARIDERGERSTGALVRFAHDGSARIELPLIYPPFYIHWSPTGEQIAYLSNWMGLEGPNMALRLVDVAANTVDTMAEGTPYYFAWAPDGTQLVAHLSEIRIELQELGGERTALATSTAAFGAPQWAADGERLVYAIREAGRQAIVLSDLAGAQQIELTDYEERASFSLSPDGSQLAFVLTPAGATANTLGPLYVTDVESLGTRQLSDDPVWAIFWSPDSRKLAYLATESGDAGLWLRWYVWDGEENRAYARYLPSRTFLQNYLVFSDQYARSMSIWSPDSSAFAYAGISERESARRGVWVQQLGDAAAEWISGGVFVAWSPR